LRPSSHHEADNSFRPSASAERMIAFDGGIATHLESRAPNIRKQQHRELAEAVV
jgi:hypothetical protein